MKSQRLRYLSWWTKQYRTKRLKRAMGVTGVTSLQNSSMCIQAKTMVRKQRGKNSCDRGLMWDSSLTQVPTVRRESVIRDIGKLILTGNHQTLRPCLWAAILDCEFKANMVNQIHLNLISKDRCAPFTINQQVKDPSQSNKRNWSRIHRESMRSVAFRILHLKLTSFQGKRESNRKH